MYNLNRKGNILKQKNNQSPNISLKWDDLKAVFTRFYCVCFIPRGKGTDPVFLINQTNSFFYSEPQELPVIF